MPVDGPSTTQTFVQANGLDNILGFEGLIAAELTITLLYQAEEDLDLSFECPTDGYITSLAEEQTAEGGDCQG